MRIPLIFTAVLVATPVLSEPLHSTPLTIHSEAIKENCNDGYWWNASENMCMSGNGR
ncbi:hypothetical protein ACS3QZ_02980 [Shimia sp. W99]